jgi:hypothetical protein
MHKFKTLLLTAVATSMLAGASGVAAPAADASLSECSFGQVCLWDNPEFSGGVRKYGGPIGWTNLSESGFNDMTTSVWNDTSVDAKLSQNAGGTGRNVCINSGETRAGLGEFNNEASAIKIFESANVC